MLTKTVLATVVRSDSTSINVLRTLTIANGIDCKTTVPVVVNRGVNAYVATVLSYVNAGGDTGQTTVIRLSFGIVNAAM